MAMRYFCIWYTLVFLSEFPRLPLIPTVLSVTAACLVYNTGVLERRLRGLPWTPKTNAPIIFM